MTCPVCGEKTIVIDSVADSDCVYRKRKCVECGHRFITAEVESNDEYTLKMLRYERKKVVKK